MTFSTMVTVKQAETIRPVHGHRKRKECATKKSDLHVFTASRSTIASATESTRNRKKCAAQCGPGSFRLTLLLRPTAAHADRQGWCLLNKQEQSSNNCKRPRGGCTRSHRARGREARSP